MDIREEKTIRSIKAAFLELRASKALEKITVKELSEKAEISKSTFYLHYADIYDLADQIGREVIDQLLSAVDNLNEIVDNPSSSILRLISVIDQNREVHIVFSGPQRYQFAGIFARGVIERLEMTHEDLPYNSSEKIRLMYKILGSYYTYSECVGQVPKEQLLREIGEIAENSQTMKRSPSETR